VKPLLEILYASRRVAEANALSVTTPPCPKTTPFSGQAFVSFLCGLCELLFKFSFVAPPHVAKLFRCRLIPFAGILRAHLKYFKAIAAMSENRVIGNGNKIPWHLPEDFKWFKKMTMGQVIVMGRKTYESIGKALPGRETIVLTRGNGNFPGARTAKNLGEIRTEEAREIYICGGADIYAQTLPQCSDLYLTLVKKTVEGDAFFPKFEDQFDLKETILENADFRILHYKNRTLPC
jgi:dihydrofolate reductase